ncbi:MAG TPA: ATP-binding protein [Gemmatimonadales bacterium]|nr:ATP-binding protein [Gemmatimonadales bacterium]
MNEQALATVLTTRFRRVAWTALAGYAGLVVVAFAVAAEAVLHRSLEHSADLVQSLLVVYKDSTGGRESVMPATLAKQLVGMGAQVVITRTTTNVGGMQQVYFLSPGMPAKRLEGLPATASPDDVRQALLAAIAQRARWRYRVLHRSAGAFDIYIVASRELNLIAFAAVAAAAALLLPVAAFSADRSARQAVAAAMRPLEGVTAETRAIGPAELGKRITSPTGQVEITTLGDAINRMLERVDRAHRALESFTADASHELRTPLTHLRAQVQWASDEERSEDQIREALVAMERALERTTKMVDELLLIARGENRQLALQRAPFELTEVMDEVKEITEAMATGKDLVIRAEAREPTRAVGDADRTRHVLLNVASNAVRYTAVGSITFGIVKNDGAVGVSIQDTGPGIAPEHLDRIFDRFYRIDQSRSRELGGTGLGLAIARLLTELQGGRLEVTSREGVGSTFTLWLPAGQP